MKNFPTEAKNLEFDSSKAEILEKKKKQSRNTFLSTAKKFVERKSKKEKNTLLAAATVAAVNLNEKSWQP